MKLYGIRAKGQDPPKRGKFHFFDGVVINTECSPTQTISRSGIPTVVRLIFTDLGFFTTWATPTEGDNPDIARIFFWL